MEADKGYDRIDPVTVAMSVKLVQPGILSDVAAGLHRIVGGDHLDKIELNMISEHLQRLISENFVYIYSGRRYALTDEGERWFRFIQINHHLDARRMFLLRETRRTKQIKRSGTRERSLNQ